MMSLRVPINRDVAISLPPHQQPDEDFLDEDEDEEDR
jgi:hypothetical protein